MERMDFYRTDLVIEHEEMVKHATEEEKDTLEETSGVQFHEEREGPFHITEVLIDEEGASRIGKKEGRYVTLAAPTLQVYEHEQLQQFMALLKRQLQNVFAQHRVAKEDRFLFIGLGNREVTPDAIGPMAMDELKEVIPEYYDESGSDVIVYAPGVTIQTGLETAHFVQAIAEEVTPDAIIIIDALAARDSNRLCKTIQLTDTGIHPGSGVGNARKELSKETLGIPVIAIGIPTVVDGPVLVADAIDTLFRYMSSQIHEATNPSSALSVAPWLRNDTSIDSEVLKPIFGDWAEWPHDDRMALLEEALRSKQLATFIAPKEIDAWVQQYAHLLAKTLREWLSEVKNLQ